VVVALNTELRLLTAVAATDVLVCKAAAVAAVPLDMPGVVVMVCQALAPAVPERGALAAVVVGVLAHLPILVAAAAAAWGFLGKGLTAVLAVKTVAVVGVPAVLVERP
jgi:hypothetical protein